MNNMLRYIVYILLFLLFTITVGQDYHTVETTDYPTDRLVTSNNKTPAKEQWTSCLPIILQICHK